MSKVGKRLIAAAGEGIAIARGDADPATYRVHGLHKGLCIGGPLDGQEVSSAASKLTVPVNPHPPRDPNESSPPVEFDSAEYRWADGAWHYQVH